MVTLSPSLEDYLEIIFLLESTKSEARPKDIANRLGVQRASVTGALRSLAEKRLINYQPYSSVTLTPEGFRLAARIVHRHKVLTEFLEKFLGLPSDVAEANACRMEHHIDDEALERLIQFIQFVQNCPRTGDDWLKAFTRLCSDPGKCSNCQACVQKCLDALD
ncbi:metal-dependent transcriptional regulator [Desulfohalobiaceae bacterium Ax17]|uniref:metal-dependent transcriptional regulator n=1 Tax=Desulfovulcanus ferrireducens TaxID=2831190 RepID=UPI00207BC11F|nr:metal-dependent transcriptional regulator [Desulfovulcanus ferrireducens]MBT8764262.1 metal-dependent transcriptional regulator [Desulfovulcanus ferrireducens]